MLVRKMGLSTYLSKYGESFIVAVVYFGSSHGLSMDYHVIEEELKSIVKVSHILERKEVNVA